MVGCSLNNDAPFVRAAADAKVIARTDDPARLRTSAVERDLASRKRVSSKRPRFEKTRCPEPLVDSDFGFRFCFFASRSCLIGNSWLGPSEVRQGAVLKYAIIR